MSKYFPMKFSFGVLLLKHEYKVLQRQHVYYRTKGLSDTDGLTLAGHQVPTKPLSHSNSSARQREKIRLKSHGLRQRNGDQLPFTFTWLWGN